MPDETEKPQGNQEATKPEVTPKVTKAKVEKSEPELSAQTKAEMAEGKKLVDARNKA